jgi:prophage DNA circulation protein
MTSGDADFYLAGIPCDGESIEDTFEQAIVVHEIPHANGALLEDMGMKARRFKISAFFSGGKYNRHKELLKSLENTLLVEFIHPEYGSMKGMIETISIKRTDEIKSATLDISFIEEEYAPVAVPMVADPKNMVQDNAQKVADTNRDLVKKITEKANSTIEAKTLLDKVIDFRKKMSEQYANLTSKARKFVKACDRVVSIAEAEINNIANPANGLISSINWAQDLPGRIASSIAYTAERYALLYDNLRNAPEKFMDNLQNARDQIKAAWKSDPEMSAFLGVADMAFAYQGTVSLSEIYSADEDNRNIARQMESQKSFDVEGVYVAARPTPKLLDIRQIDRSLQISNRMAQDAIDSARAIGCPADPLKECVNALIDHTTYIKLEMERIKEINIAYETPLHLICLQNGLPASMAERIVGLNSLKNPSFVKGKVNIYAAR